MLWTFSKLIWIDCSDYFAVILPIQVKSNYINTYSHWFWPWLVKWEQNFSWYFALILPNNVKISCINYWQLISPTGRASKPSQLTHWPLAVGRTRWYQYTPLQLRWEGLEHSHTICVWIWWHKDAPLWEYSNPAPHWLVWGRKITNYKFNFNKMPVLPPHTKGTH